MSDMLEKLLNVEKTAAGLVTEAEAEAARRTGKARAESQKATAALLKEKAIAVDEAIETERARIAAERERKNAEYRETLKRMPSDSAGFNRAALSFMDKGSA
jgi:hypothetical protein